MPLPPWSGLDPDRWDRYGRGRLVLLGSFAAGMVDAKFTGVTEAAERKGLHQGREGLDMGFVPSIKLTHFTDAKF